LDSETQRANLLGACTRQVAVKAKAAKAAKTAQRSTACMDGRPIL